MAVFKLKRGTADEQVERVVNELKGLQVPGLINVSIGRDAGLREGNLDLAVVVDLDDDEAYRAYDGDPEHNRIRRELVAPIIERGERVQFHI